VFSTAMSAKNIKNTNKSPIVTHQLAAPIIISKIVFDEEEEEKSDSTPFVKRPKKASIKMVSLFTLHFPKEYKNQHIYFGT
jgi:hypothetical protein